MVYRALMATAILAALGAGSPAVHAQEAVAARSTTQGLSVGVHGATAALTLSEDRSTALGGGIGVVLGYAFGDRVSIHSATSGAFMAPSGQDSYVLSHVDLEGRYTFGSRSRAWAPHIALGSSARTAHYEVPDSQGERTVARTTLGLTAGSGISYYLSPSASLDWSLRYTFGNLKQRTCPDASEAVRTCATTTRVAFGASWYPFAR